MNAVDTTVPSYRLDRQEPAERAQARELLRYLSSVPTPTIQFWQALDEQQPNWDSTQRKVTNVAKANEYLHYEYRRGWSL